MSSGGRHSTSLAAAVSLLLSTTYIVVPGHFVGLRVRVDVALKVDIITLLDVVRVQRGAHLQRHHWIICDERKTGIQNAHETD